MWDRDPCVSARVVSDGLAVERHVEVAAHEDGLALEIGLGEIANLETRAQAE